MVYLHASRYSRLLDDRVAMAEVHTVKDYGDEKKTRVLHTCPIIDTFYITPELSVTYVPVLKETTGLRKQRGTPDLKFVLVPKRGEALLMPYVPQYKDGQIYMKTPKGLCCCPTCLKLVLSRCPNNTGWSAEICKIYELQGHIAPAKYQRTEQMFQSWDSAFPQPPAGGTVDQCFPYHQMENTM